MVTTNWINIVNLCQLFNETKTKDTKSSKKTDAAVISPDHGSHVQYMLLLTVQQNRTCKFKLMQKNSFYCRDILGIFLPHAGLKCVSDNCTGNWSLNTQLTASVKNSVTVILVMVVLRRHLQ